MIALGTSPRRISLPYQFGSGSVQHPFRAPTLRKQLDSLERSSVISQQINVLKRRGSIRCVKVGSQ